MESGPEQTETAADIQLLQPEEVESQFGGRSLDDIIKLCPFLAGMDPTRAIVYVRSSPPEMLASHSEQHYEVRRAEKATAIFTETPKEPDQPQERRDISSIEVPVIEKIEPIKVTTPKSDLRQDIERFHAINSNVTAE
ncbi:MAG: hypothetical protein M3Q14_02385, partial [bacterium]|nr:hypothetical protein [bacterium]